MMLAPIQAFYDHRLFGQLPRLGGTFDQDPDLMEEMRQVAGIVAEEEERQAKAKESTSRWRGRRKGR
jgi:hypothetical protein